MSYFTVACVGVIPVTDSTFAFALAYSLFVAWLSSTDVKSDPFSSRGTRSGVGVLKSKNFVQFAVISAAAAADDVGLALVALGVAVAFGVEELDGVLLPHAVTADARAHAASTIRARI